MFQNCLAEFELYCSIEGADHLTRTPLGHAIVSSCQKQKVSNARHKNFTVVKIVKEFFLLIYAMDTYQGIRTKHFITYF